LPNRQNAFILFCSRVTPKGRLLSEFELLVRRVFAQPHNIIYKAATSVVGNETRQQQTLDLQETIYDQRVIVFTAGAPLAKSWKGAST
jgi:hypothetical protein